MPSRAATWFAPTHTCPPEYAAAPPSTLDDSNTVTSRPASAAPTAVASPDKPPPATTTRRPAIAPGAGMVPAGLSVTGTSSSRHLPCWRGASWPRRRDQRRSYLVLAKDLLGQGVPVGGG